MSLDHSPGSVDGQYLKVLAPRPDECFVKKPIDDSWENAARHPVITTLVLFAGGLIGVGCVLYFGPGGGNLKESLAGGPLAAGGLVIFGVREMRRQHAHVPIAPSRISVVVQAALAVAGGALIVWGAVASSWDLAIAGLWLLALPIGLVLLPVALIRIRRR